MDSERTSLALKQKQLVMKPHDIDTGSAVIKVLVVTHFERDFKALARMLPKPKWVLHTASSVPSALSQLNGADRIPLVLCERELLPGSWKQILEFLKGAGDRSLMILASRLEDEQLWAEALNHGVRDVLAKPFDEVEVRRILSLAWLSVCRTSSMRQDVGPTNSWDCTQ